MRALAISCLFIAAAAAAQQAEPPNAVLLVARPGLADPNFRETVVLATRRPDGQTLGVILNRPARLRPADLLPDLESAQRDAGPVHFGGPVLRRTAIAVFHAAQAPQESAFHVLQDVYFSMHPANIRALLERRGAQFRLYAGFCAWAAGQLESEIARDDWYVLPASEALVFRSDTAGLWSELYQKASGVRARQEAIYFPS